MYKELVRGMKKMAVAQELGMLEIVVDMLKRGI
jgi:hypothetical protein